MPSFFRPAIAAVVFVASGGICAQQPDTQPEQKYYDVELIIFKNISVPKAHEFNLPTPSASRQHNTLDLFDPNSVQKAAEIGFTPLPVEELRLQESVRNIIKSSRYELLLHTGWRQPGLDEANSFPVWVKGGRVYDSRYSSIDQVTDVSEKTQQAPADGLPSTPATPDTSFIKPYTPDYLYELEGQITITLSRYLHTRAQLVLRKPAEPGNLLILNEESEAENAPEDLALEGQLLLNYALNEQRRMRSRKLHYLDHPEFGMLVLITPYEAPQEQQEAMQDPASENTPPPVDSAANAG